MLDREIKAKGASQGNKSVNGVRIKNLSYFIYIMLPYLNVSVCREYKKINLKKFFQICWQ